MRVVILLLAILALSAFIGCQSKPMVVSESQPGLEGIKVHGDWTVEVTNPDGSLATRKQFANTFNGAHLVAAWLSFDFEIERKMDLKFTETHDGGQDNTTNKVQCEDLSINKNSMGGLTPNTIHSPNDDGYMNKSIWNASCTVKIADGETGFLNGVGTRVHTTPDIYKTADSANDAHPFSMKYFVYHKVKSMWPPGHVNPIPVFDGQVIAATVTFSVD